MYGHTRLNLWSHYHTIILTLYLSSSENKTKINIPEPSLLTQHPPTRKEQQNLTSITAVSYKISTVHYTNNGPWPQVKRRRNEMTL